MEDFIWDDGGRAACGFVGLAGDCVTRSIAIGTGINYRSVYDELGLRAKKTARNGLPAEIGGQYLQQLGWQRIDSSWMDRFQPVILPKGIFVFHLWDEDQKNHHFTTVIDGVVHDTWNPAEDEYFYRSYWSAPESACENRRQQVVQKSAGDAESELTQHEFEKILKRLKALDRTATNRASTEGEKRNALRMMQTLLLKHNLDRDDIDQDSNDNVQFCRKSCYVNGRKACGWEYRLAHYICNQILPMVQFYYGTAGHRTRLHFFGPRQDVDNAIELFRELLVTIASSARLQYGGYSRGSGASYCEGYVAGLPKESGIPSNHGQETSQTYKLIQTKTLSLKLAANKWLFEETGIKLVLSRGGGRRQTDPNAKILGMKHGASQDIRPSNRPKRLT